MSVREKMPKLVDVYRPTTVLERRQLPLVVEEKLTLVMDVRSSGIICDNQLLRGKELEEFAKKFSVLSQDQLQNSLQISKNELIGVLNENVPCVGCRRSVERLYLQLLKCGHPTLDPLIVNSDGMITIKEEKQIYPILGSIFHDHATRLEKLIENQPKRNKKSVRCLLHSLDSQRSRPLTPVWRDVWECMKPECKKDICIIEADTLHTTLETYLRKHRFCCECRTKVFKAYSLLVEEAEPTKEKGYVSALYAGIKKCLDYKHIHLQAKTEYITKLISRAEPELLGSFSRRERHAKTLEIAQEEVLTCLGICMYERLHRIYMRMREEECTCLVFAAVAVHTLSRSFETAVEKIRGISKLELLYKQFAKEEQQKQIRKEQKKIKRKRKKEKMVEKECEGCGCEEKCDCDAYWGECKYEGNEMEEKVAKENGSNSDHSHDCGYSSENNNGCCETGSLISSLSSSPDGSELACSEECCQMEGGDGKWQWHWGRENYHPSLQEMLECGNSDEGDDDNCFISPEEVKEFESNNRQVFERRQALRETLQKRFAQFCVNGPLQVPRLLVQSKYASN